LDERERKFAESIGALEVNDDNREILAGLSRWESEWLILWRRLSVHERRERKSYMDDICAAEQLEEDHEMRRRNRNPF
jgi:hypothetical protein